LFWLGVVPAGRCSGWALFRLGVVPAGRCSGWALFRLAPAPRLAAQAPAPAPETLAGGGGGSGEFYACRLQVLDGLRGRFRGDTRGEGE
jgi:hypothetical protein